MSIMNPYMPSGMALLGSLLGGVLAMMVPVPQWNGIHAWIVFGLGLAGITAGLFLTLRNAPAMKFRHRIILGVVAIAAVALSFISTAGVVFSPQGREIAGPNGTSIYVYEHACFPPDNRSECGIYSSDARVRLGSTPFTRSVYSCRCFFGDPIISGVVANIPLEENQDEGPNRIEIDFSTGARVGL